MQVAFCQYQFRQTFENENVGSIICGGCIFGDWEQGSTILQYKMLNPIVESVRNAKYSETVANSPNHVLDAAFDSFMNQSEILHTI